MPSLLLALFLIATICIPTFIAATMLFDWIRPRAEGRIVRRLRRHVAGWGLICDGCEGTMTGSVTDGGVQFTCPDCGDTVDTPVNLREDKHAGPL